MRCHIHHVVSSMRSMEVIEVGKEFEFISVFMNINEKWVFSHMFPECTMVSFHFSIMFRCIWRILLMFNTKLHEKLCESLSKLTSTISTNDLYSCGIVWWCLEKVPNKLHTWAYTMLGVHPRDNESTTIINGIILHLGSRSSERKAYIKLHFLPWYFKRVFLQTLSSHILCISCISYLISLENSVYSRLINSLSRNIFYSPWEFTSSKEWHLLSKSTYLFFQMERSSIVYLKSYSSIRKPFRFWSWWSWYKSSIRVHSIPSYPFGYWLSRHIKVLCYFYNRFLLLKYISYCLYFHSNIFVTLKSWSHRRERLWIVNRLAPISFISYPIYLDISTEGDVNLIAAIVTIDYAGELDFDANWNISTWRNHSGHYQPDSNDIEWKNLIIQYLRSRANIDLSKIPFTSVSN